MRRRLSEDEAPEEVRHLELRVEVRFHVQERVEPVVLRGGHLQVPGHLDRLEPGDVGQDVPEAERELRPPADRGEETRPLLKSALIPAGNARGAVARRNRWKPGARGRLPTPTLPSMPRSSRQEPPHGSYTVIKPYQVLIMESVAGVKHVVTIQRANVVRKSVSRTHQGVRSILRPYPTNLVEGTNRGGSCYVQKERRHRCRLSFVEHGPVQVRGVATSS